MNTNNIKVKDIMNKDIITIDRDTTITNAAKIMTDNNIGFLPVLNKGSIVGVLTDRDIINRIISKEKDIYASVFLAMSTDIESIQKNDDINIAINKMATKQIRRIIVLNKKQDLVGILSLTDIANNKDTKKYLPELISQILHPEVRDLLLIKNTSIKI